MSANRKVFTNFDRIEMDKNNRPINIWRQRTEYLTKNEVIKAKENRENLKLVAS